MMKSNFASRYAGYLIVALVGVPTLSHAGTIEVSSVAIEYTDAGQQLLRILGSGLKDAGDTRVSLGDIALDVEIASDAMLVAKCPGAACQQKLQRLTVSTYTMGKSPSLVSSLAWNYDPLITNSPPPRPMAVARPLLLQGAYGALACARNVLPAAGACPTGYSQVGIAELSFGDATACQSDAGGDVPAVQVKSLCMRAAR